MQQIKILMNSTSPLLMHAATTADPLDQRTKDHKQLTSKKKKTDDDYETIAQSEWFLGLYCGKQGPFIPGQNFESSFVDAAKMRRLGQTFKQSVRVLEDEVVLKYSGPRDPLKLFADPRFRDGRQVRVNGKRIMRYRPIFHTWSASLTVCFEEQRVEERDLISAIQDAGRLIGVCDFRPRFGHFDAVVTK